jgi:hypothetical protein
MKNINASFNLAEALSDFQASVKKSLEIVEVVNWDGNTVREREEKIREAALILAGQCIAILLYNLSQLPEAQTTAKEKTAGWWQGRCVRHLTCWREILTVGNVVVRLKLPYILEKSCRDEEEKRKKINQGFCPFLRWLGMGEGVSPLVWSVIAKYGTISSSFEVARTQLIDWGIKVSLKRVERLTYKFGKIGLSLRNAKIFSLNLGTLATGETLKDKKVVIAVDGGRSRERVDKKGRKRAKTNRHRYTAEWVEPKLMTIYVVDEQGKKIKNADIPITNDGTYENHIEFVKILEAHLVGLGINQAKQVLLIADAAAWIWKDIPPLLSKLRSPESTYELIDFYHVAERLSTFSKVAFTDENERHKWFKTARSLLKYGKVSDLLIDMNSLHQQANNETKDALMNQINYITNRHNEGRLNYPQVAAQNLPLGSGAIESLVRQVVNLRLKGNGKFWLKEHAEIILHSRCQWTAHNWHNFCNSIFTCFICPVTSG